MEDISVAITLGNQQEIGLNQENELVIQDRDKAGTSINLGPYTRSRCMDLMEYLQRLSIHVP